jgi:hypothetical protein
MPILFDVIAQLLKAVLPELLSFAWEKAHESTTIEDGATDPARRQRLLDAIRLRGSPGGGSSDNRAAPTG